MNDEPIGYYPSSRTVWRSIIIYLMVICIALALFTCRAIAAPSLEDVATSPTTFAACKAADIGTTAYILSHGGVENNPIVAWSLRIGGYAPLVFVSIGIYWAMTKWGTPVTNTFTNVATCGVAIHNLMQIP